MKYLKLSVAHSGELIGATVNASLLESSRVCGLDGQQDNFHIFQYLEGWDIHIGQCMKTSTEYERIEKWLRSIGFSKLIVMGIRKLVRGIELVSTSVR